MSNTNSLSPAYFNQYIENVSNNETELSDLPDEILLKIFKYFSFCEMRKYATVCKRWHDLSWSGSLLHNVKIKRKYIPMYILAKILRSGVKKLKMKSCSLSLPYDGIRFKGARFNTLQALYMEVTGIDEPFDVDGPFYTFLEYILSSCSNLQELRLFHVILDEKFFRIILDMKFLQILYIHLIAYKSSSYISKCVGKCARFDGLKMCKIYVDCIAGDNKFSVIETLIMSVPDLRFLIISNSISMDMCTCESPTFFKQLSMLKHLEVLKLPCMCITSTSAVFDTLKSIEWRTSFENLKKLSLCKTEFREDDLQLQKTFILNFLKPCLNLETLALAGIPFNNELILKLSQMTKLKELKICCLYTDYFIPSPTEFERSIELGITTLKIKHTAKLYRTPFMLSFLTYCPKVESLYFKNCLVTKEIFEYIRGITSLQKLHLKKLWGDRWSVPFFVFRDKKIIDLSKYPQYTEEIEILFQELAEIKSE